MTRNRPLPDRVHVPGVVEPGRDLGDLAGGARPGGAVAGAATARSGAEVGASAAGRRAGSPTAPTRARAPTAEEHAAPGTSTRASTAARRRVMRSRYVRAVASPASVGTRRRVRWGASGARRVRWSRCEERWRRDSKPPVRRSRESAQDPVHNRLLSRFGVGGRGSVVTWPQCSEGSEHAEPAGTLVRPVASSSSAPARPRASASSPTSARAWAAGVGGTSEGQVERGRQVGGVHRELERPRRQVVRQPHPAHDRGQQLRAVAGVDQPGHPGGELRHGGWGVAHPGPAPASRPR